MPNAERLRASAPFHYARNVSGAVISCCVVFLMTLLGAVAPWLIEEFCHE
ncbi:MAG: hypothetical protein WDN46_05065 [Methylocella sp.]